jgi:transposase InsO family protein
MTVLDDFSRLSVVRCMSREADVPEALKSVIALLETQSSQRVQCIRSDKGGDFVNNSLKPFYQFKGIVQEVTAGYSPKSNGVAECVQRTLLERVRAVLLDACMPALFWGEAVVAACYVRNRSPVSDASVQTHLGLFSGGKLDVSNLNVFGCKVHVHRTAQLRSKLDVLSRPGHLVTYDGAGYRVWLDGATSVIAARDSVCLENEVAIGPQVESVDRPDTSRETALPMPCPG